MKAPKLLICAAVAFFSFFVQKITAQCSLTCLGDVQISLSADSCKALVIPEVLLSDPSLCTGTKIVEILDSLGNVIPSSPYIDANYIGQTLVARVTHPASGNRCWTNLHIEDKTAPVLICRDTFLLCNQTPNPATLGYPTAYDNCGQSFSLTYSDIFQEYACGGIYTAVYIRTWTAIDVSGNVSTCVQNIFVKKATLADVVFPAHLDGFVQPALQCGASTSPTAAGEPMVFGSSINAFSCSLVAIYDDIVINTCGGSFKIVRTWTVSDACTGAYLTGVQLIKVGDFLPPNMVAQGDTTISTNLNACTATFKIPLPSVTDACSNWTLQTSIDAPAVYVDSSRLATGLPIGNTVVTYTATDACGNVAARTFTVTVTDQVAPVAVCAQLTQIDLDNTGQAMLFANSLDAGSHDNCGIQGFEIRRLDKNIPFDSLAHFDCADVDSTVSVVLRVRDAVGNLNTCTVQITVKDKLAPSITFCPANLTLECGNTNYSNTAITGVATASDNCQASISHSDQNNLTACGTGTIARTWKATDRVGLTAVCVQTITLKNSSPFFINKINTLDPTDDVEWPADISTTACGAATQPVTTGEPKILNNRALCNSLTITYADQVFPIQAPSCYKIIRKWTIIDWCQYQLGSVTGVGVWDYKQTIKVSNIIAPTFTSRCTDTTILVLPTQCEATAVTLKATASDDCTSNGLLRWTFKIDKDNNGTIDTSGTSRTINLQLSVGKHRLFWTVEDGCGNIKSCDYLVTIKDGKKPTPVCINGIAASLMPTTGSVALTPEMLDGGSYDNCTAAAQLVKTLTPNTFTCDNRGPNIVRLTVTDAAGNSDFCTTLVRIQDNSQICPPSANGATISGLIQTQSGQNIAGVNVSIGNNIFPNVLTTSAGDYNFTNLLTGSNYQVTPAKDTNPLNGVSTFDLVLMSRHILGITPFTSPYQLIAADINRSGTITTFDMVQLRQLILGNVSRFQNNTSWRFVDKNFVFPDPSNPFLTIFPETCPLDSLMADKQINFVGIKIGDLNGNAQTSDAVASSNAERAAAQLLTISVADQALVAGKTYTVALSSEKKIAGLQMTLGFDADALEFEGVENTADFGAENIAAQQISEGKIPMIYIQNSDKQQLWEGKFIFRAKTNTTWAKCLHLASTALANEAYGQTAASEPIEKYDLKIQFRQANGQVAEAESKLELYQNRPNPFAENTVIAYALPKAGSVRLRVFTVAGAVLYDRRLESSEGYNEIMLYRKDLPSSGVLYYEVASEQGNAVRKMILE